ncbi:MAG TPA: hypothetical protein VFQ61_12625 [Polyangiaceae bacterium]|nr:hypothetical protein [Polyangiaceae bacterium]
MEQTYDYSGISVDRAIQEIQNDKRRKPAVVLAVIALGVIAAMGLTYFSYRDVPAPLNPANARPHMVEPYH